MAAPVSIETIPVRKELLQDIATLAAIDRGGSLTKILYVPKTEPKEDYITLTCAVFHNDDFEDGVDWLTKEGLLPTQGALHVTGIGCDLYRDMIAKKTGLSVEFVDEIQSQVQGSKFLITHLEDSEFCFPDFEPNLFYKVTHSGSFKKIGDKMSEKFKSLNAEDRFPLIFASLGSAAGMTKLNADGSIDVCGGSFICGRTLLGLGKLLLGTSNYDEIMELAAKGNRGNVDTQIQDVFSMENSPYGTFDPAMPLFPFGKAGETNCDGSEFAKEDIAAALVAMLLMNIMAIAGGIARENGCARIYFGGNLARAEVARGMLYERLRMFPLGPLRIKFVKTGHTGALGAMLTKPGEALA